MSNHSLTRRDFLKTAALAAAGAAIVAGLGATPAFAEAVTSAQCDDLLVINENGVRYEIHVAENGGVRTITTTNTATGAIDEIIFDQNNSTVYSTYTGETVELIGELAPSAEEELPGHARSRTSYSSKNISYAQIKSVVGYIATAAALASAILAFVASATMATNVASLVSAVGSAINGVANPSTAHGVKVRIATTKYYRNGNHVPYRTVKQIVAASLY